MTIHDWFDIISGAFGLGLAGYAYIGRRALRDISVLQRQMGETRRALDETRNHVGLKLFDYTD